MWTLVLIGILINHDQPFMSTVPGFSTKEYCEAAGKTYIESDRKNIFKSKPSNIFASDQVSYAVSWNYRCIEVK